MSYETSISRERFRPCLPTASGLTRALACPTSCVLPQVTALASPWAESGRALHAFVEAVAKGKTPTEAAQAVPAEMRDTALSLDLAGWPVDVTAGWSSELAVAYHLDHDAARLLDAAQRAYSHKPTVEIAGTADLVRVHDGCVWVVDIKTGRGWLPRPLESGQLRFLALAFARLYGVDSAEVGHLRVDGDGRAWLDLDTLDALELATVRDQLLEAREAVQAGIIAPKEGQWCRYCPAFVACPAKASLITRIEDVDGPLDRDVAARAWQRIKDVRAVCDRMEASLKEYAAREAVPLADGWELAEVEVTREQLDARKAHAAVLALCGPEAADAAVELTATKSSLEEAARAFVAAEKLAGRKATFAAVKRTLLARIAYDGGLTQTVKREVKERRRKAGEP